MKRLLPVTAVLVSLLVLSGAATWLLRDSLSRSAANHLLDGSGLRITEITDIQPSLSGTTVGEVAVELTGSGRVQRFHDIEVDYTASGLRSGQVQNIRVGKAALDLAPGAAASEPDAEVPQLTDVSERIRQAPLQSLHVDDLRIHHLPANQRSMALTLRWQDNRLTGQLGDGETDIQLDVDWQVDGTAHAQASPASPAPFEAGLRAQTGSLPALEVGLAVVPRNGMLDVQASSHVESGAAQPVIEAVAELLSLPPLDESPLSVSADVALQAMVPDALAIPRTLQLTATIEAGGNIVVPASLFPDARIGTVEGHWEEPVTLTLERRGAGSEPEFTVTGNHLAMAVSDMGASTARVINAALTLDDYRLHCLSLATCDFAAGSALKAESVVLALPENESSESIRLREPSLSIPALDGSLADDTLSLQFSAGTQLSLPEAGLGALSARDTEVTLHAAASLNGPLAELDELRVQAGELSVDLPLLRNGDHMAGLQLHAHHLEVRPLGTFELDTDIRLSNAYTNLFTVNLWDAVLTADIVVDDDVASFDAAVALNDRRVATVEGSHSLGASTGEGRLEVPEVTFDVGGNSLSDFIDPLPVPTDLVSGTVAGQAELQWQRQEGQAMPSITGMMDVALTDLGGHFEDFVFDGLDTRLHARLDEDMHLQSVSEEQFRLGSLDVGVIIEDIETSFSFDSAGSSITLREAGMAIFGGRISADRLEYHASAEANTNTVAVKRIDIERILSLSAYEGVAATGIVSGEIPLTISGAQVTVSGGRLSALPPGGTISYRDAPADTGNANLDLVYSALANYRYSTLEAEVDYMEDGELLLAVSMEGVATEVGEGQRVNLNVNISDNIPDLLESLQAGRDIADSVEFLGTPGGTE